MILSVVAILIAAVSAAKVQETAIKATDNLVILDYQSKLEIMSANPAETISIRVSNRSPSPIDRMTILVPEDRLLIGSVIEDAYGNKLNIRPLNQSVVAKDSNGK